MYKKWKADEYGIIDLMREIPSLMVDSSVLVYHLKPLLPRVYSIASSLDYAKEIEGSEGKMFVDLLVTVVEYTIDGQTRKNIERKGFCSNYLADLEIGSDVSMYLRSSPSFHLPDHSDGKTPILLVAAGSGLAPFRGFWQRQLYNAMKNNQEDINDIVNRLENLDYNDEKEVARVRAMI